MRSFIFFLLVLATVALASCGSGPAGPAKAAAPTATLTPTPLPTDTPTPTPTATATPQPTQPSGAPAILDLRPASMSFVGHLDCQHPGEYVCVAQVISRSSNQSDLHWSASTNVPGNITFSPASGVLAPGQSVLVNITIPLTACTKGLFFFKGPINTHTITWAC